jgi:hypothetical protein
MAKNLDSPEDGKPLFGCNGTPAGESEGELAAGSTVEASSSSSISVLGLSI